MCVLISIQVHPGGAVVGWQSWSSGEGARNFRWSFGAIRPCRIAMLLGVDEAKGAVCQEEGAVCQEGGQFPSLCLAAIQGKIFSVATFKNKKNPKPLSI